MILNIFKYFSFLNKQSDIFTGLVNKKAGINQKLNGTFVRAIKYGYYGSEILQLNYLHVNRLQRYKISSLVE